MRKKENWNATVMMAVKRSNLSSRTLVMFGRMYGKGRG